MATIYELEDWCGNKDYVENIFKDERYIVDKIDKQFVVFDSVNTKFWHIVRCYVDSGEKFE